MTEAEFQRNVTDLCDWLGLRWHHETDSRKSKKGFPDLCIVGPGGIVFAELKTDRGKVSKEQEDWLLDIRRAGGRAYVWRPRYWDQVKHVLFEIAKR